jgi:hypothetical protein
MWVEVQVCRGPTGEKLKRADWKPVGRGKLRIYHCYSRKAGICASLERDDCGKFYQILYPISDVRVLTFEAGFAVVGLQISTERGGAVIREYRQAWYCVPVLPMPAA